MENKNKVSLKSVFKDGVLTSNPLFVSLLGLCPALAITDKFMNAIGMTFAFFFVLLLSNVVISLLRKLIPNEIRIPVYIIIIATVVTVVKMLMSAFMATVFNSLGVYLSLIVVNCIILGRAESYASKNTPILSLFDGIGMGLGFTIALTLLGMFREVLGAGTIFGFNFIPANNPTSFEPISIFVMAPGAFFVLAFLVAIMNKIKTKKGKPIIDICRNEGCVGCTNTSCAGRCNKEVAD